MDFCDSAVVLLVCGEQANRKERVNMQGSSWFYFVDSSFGGSSTAQIVNTSPGYTPSLRAGRLFGNMTLSVPYGPMWLGLATLDCLMAVDAAQVTNLMFAINYTLPAVPNITAELYVIADNSDSFNLNLDGSITPGVWSEEDFSLGGFTPGGGNVFGATNLETSLVQLEFGYIAFDSVPGANDSYEILVDDIRFY